MNWDAAAVATLKQMWEAGASDADIAAAFDVKVSAMKTAARRFGLSSRVPPPAARAAAAKARHDGRRQLMASRAAAKDWDGALRALRGGMPLTGLDAPSSKAAGYPSYHLFMKRVAEDQAFSTLARPLFAAPPPPAEYAFQSALRRLEEGALLKDVLDGPGQPSRHQWRRRKATDPAFASKVEWALRTNASKAWVSAETWDRVVAAAEVLPSLVAVAKQDGMPSYEAILAKMKRDAAFDAQIRQRVQMGEKIRRSEADIAAAVEALTGGASYTAVQAATGIGRKTILKRIQALPELSERAAGVLPTVRAWSEADVRRSIENVGGDVSFRKLAQVGLVPRATIRKWRLRDPSIDAAAAEAARRVRVGRAAFYGASDYERALRHLQEGNGISSLAASGHPRAEALRNWGRANPDFAERYRAAVGIYRGLGSNDVGAALKRALSKNELYAAVDRVIGRGLDAYVRDEIRSEMILAVLEGEITEAEITSQTARAFVAAHNRSAGAWLTRSMDASLYGDRRTLHDVLSS